MSIRTFLGWFVALVPWTIFVRLMTKSYFDPKWMDLGTAVLHGSGFIGILLWLWWGYRKHLQGEWDDS